MVRPIILSGGSEIVGLSLIEEFRSEEIPVAVISLNKRSLLTGCTDDMLYEQIDWPPDSSLSAQRQITTILQRWRDKKDPPWPIFATEDGGLGFIMDIKDTLASLILPCSNCRLENNCYDKAELSLAFEKNESINRYHPKTWVSTTAQEAVQSIKEYGFDCVVKPAVKPYSMSFPHMSSKAVFSRLFASAEKLEAHLNANWRDAPKWIVQKEIGRERDEISVWAMRDRQGNIQSVSVRQQHKYPREGGTSTLVCTIQNPDSRLIDAVQKILEELNYTGMCELEFLIDYSDVDSPDITLVEINSRPWLQYGLMGKLGRKSATECFRMLTDDEHVLESTVDCVEDKTWVTPERYLLAAISQTKNNMLLSAITAVIGIVKADYLTVYSTRIRYVKRRWIQSLIVRMAKI